GAGGDAPAALADVQRLLQPHEAVAGQQVDVAGGPLQGAVAQRPGGAADVAGLVGDGHAAAGAAAGEVDQVGEQRGLLRAVGQGLVVDLDLGRVVERPGQDLVAGAVGGALGAGVED